MRMTAVSSTCRNAPQKTNNSQIDGCNNDGIPLLQLPLDILILLALLDLDLFLACFLAIFLSPTLVLLQLPLNTFPLDLFLARDLIRDSSRRLTGWIDSPAR
jgi:hypothetical protein